MAGWLRYKEQCPLLTQHGRTLCYIADKKEVSKDDVATHLELSRQSASRILAELQSEGLVAHERISNKVAVWRLTGTSVEAMHRLVTDEGVGK